MRQGLGIIAFLGVAVSSRFVSLEPTHPAGASIPESAASLHIVGGPVGVGNVAVVIYVDSTHNLHLAAVDPVSGRVMWQYPYSATGATPRVALYPDASGNLVMDVAPAGNSKGPFVRLLAIDATTGGVVWRSTGSFIASDAPSQCARGKYFCIPGYNENGSTSLLLIDPTTGFAQGLLNGPSREMGPDLYETDASTPTLEQESSPSGTEAWRTSVASFSLWGISWST